eukprot:GHVH01006923.1.p1 GENE.GHVH01006923.1~~GHVH01006923.1.p1  ORF type:complete len:338 (+),score=41.47 GHVH01006923.1:640-1653(+)
MLKGRHRIGNGMVKVALFCQILNSKFSANKAFDFDTIPQQFNIPDVERILNNVKIMKCDASGYYCIGFKQSKTLFSLWRVTQSRFWMHSKVYRHHAAEALGVQMKDMLSAIKDVIILDGGITLAKSRVNMDAFLSQDDSLIKQVVQLRSRSGENVAIKNALELHDRFSRGFFGRKWVRGTYKGFVLDPLDQGIWWSNSHDRTLEALVEHKKSLAPILSNIEYVFYLRRIACSNRQSPLLHVPFYKHEEDEFCRFLTNDEELKRMNYVPFKQIEPFFIRKTEMTKDNFEQLSKADALMGELIQLCCREVEEQMTKKLCNGVPHMNMPAHRVSVGIMGL